MMIMVISMYMFNVSKVMITNEERLRYGRLRRRTFLSSSVALDAYVILEYRITGQYVAECLLEPPVAILVLRACAIVLTISTNFW